MARSRMNVTVKTASVRPTRSSTALDNAAARPLSISRNRWRLMISTRLEVDLLVVLIVSLDDHLHQLMADDVALVEVDERYSFDAADDALRFHQARLATRRQVDLRHVAGDYGLRPEADARQKHLHLLGGRVLRLVENDKRIPQRTSPHECPRRDLDHALYNEFGHALVIDQIEERVVKRAQIRIDFVLQVSRQEAELFAGLDRRARKDDAIDSLRHQILHGHRHGQKCFAGSGGTYSENDVVLFNRFEVKFLIGAARGDLFTTGRVDPLLPLQRFSQRRSAVVGDLFERVAQLAGRGRAAFVEEFPVIFQDALDDGDVGLVAFDYQFGAPAPHSHAEQRFQIFDVLVMRAEQRFKPALRQCDF